MRRGRSAGPYFIANPAACAGSPAAACSIRRVDDEAGGDPLVEARGDRPGDRARRRAGRARVGIAVGAAARAVAHVRPCGAPGRRDRPHGLERLPRGRAGRVRRGTPRSLREARAARARRIQPLLRRQPARSGTVFDGLEPLVRPRARRRAGGRRRAAARAHGLAVQHARRRAPLSRSRVCRRRDPRPRPRHGARGAHRRPLAGMVAGHAARCARGAATSAGTRAAARGRLLERRCARDEVRARCDRRPLAAASRPARADLADDRRDEHGALRGHRRLARAVPIVCPRRMARHRSRVQPVQVQLVPGQRREAVVARPAPAAGPESGPPAARAGSRTTSRATRATGSSPSCPRSSRSSRSSTSR